jgi:hypothetical protein
MIPPIGKSMKTNTIDRPGVAMRINGKIGYRLVL